MPERSDFSSDANPAMPGKNVMLAATISVGAVSAPVRIRTLSQDGAMVDGLTLPDAGMTVTLSRLGLAIGAKVLWSREGRCGLGLERTIRVDDWIAGVSTASSGGLGQARVDQLQAAIRSGAALPAETQAFEPAESASLERALAAELARLKQTLDEISEELTDDVDVLMRHERALQSFDIATSIVGELARIVAADDREAAVGAVQMHDLRSRLSGRPTLT